MRFNLVGQLRRNFFHNLVASLAPRSQSILFVDQLFSDVGRIDGFVGTLWIDSDQPVPMMALRFSGALFTSLSPFSAQLRPTGVRFGADISKADQDLIGQAYSLSQSFWEIPAVYFSAYSSIDTVLTAYTDTCSCSVPSYARQELTFEFVTTAPGVLMVMVGDVTPQNREIPTIHSFIRYSTQSKEATPKVM